MRIFIYGYNGNMGRRYRAILDHLGHKHGGYDCNEREFTLYGDIEKPVDAFIIASPTDLHLEHMQQCAKLGRPILCEKPVHKDVKELEMFLESHPDLWIRMVDQYEFLIIDDEATGKSYYDNWNHGKDGIYWDCMNIIYWANGPIRLKEESPIWKCCINGEELNIKNMDKAYIQMIEDWLQTIRRFPNDKSIIAADRERIIEGHRKVQDMIDGK